MPFFIFFESRICACNSFITSSIGWFLNEKKKKIKIRFFSRFSSSNSNWNIELRLSVDLKTWLFLHDLTQLINNARLDIQLLSESWCQNHWDISFVILYLNDSSILKRMINKSYICSLYFYIFFLYCIKLI